MNSPRRLLILSIKSADWSGTIMEMDPQHAGFGYLKFEVRRLEVGENHQTSTNSMNLAL